MSRFPRFLTLLICLCPLAIVVSGCGAGDSADAMFAEANDMNIKRVSSLYAVFQGQHKYKGPKDEAELKAFVAQQNKKHLERIGVNPDKLDQLFISERDNQPFKIRWELICRPRSAPKPIVFEQEGVNGKYMVAFSSYVVKEVDKTEYDRLWEGEMDDVAPDENRGGVPGR